jgi:rare lipoprotein A
VGLLWGSALSVPSLKVLILAAALVASLTLAQGKADAEPMLASWYGPGLEGNLTASGERFNAKAFTAASPSLPFGTKIRVCYKRGCVIVRVNDRGPYAGGRDLDLSQGAAKAIGLTAVGVDYVDATVLAS